MGSRLRILVIDDDPMFRNVIISHLRKEYIVSVASDGQSGFEKAILHRPDLVIIDYQMPGWDGIRTLSSFRNDVRFKSTKTVMLTSDASKETVMSAIQAGTDSYIIKTAFDKNEFLTKIQELLKPTIFRSAGTKQAPVVNTAGVEAKAEAPAPAKPVQQTSPTPPEIKPEVRVESKKADSPAATKTESKQTPGNKPSAPPVEKEPTEAELAEEMAAFQKTLDQQSKKTVETDTNDNIPAQGIESFEEELLEDAIEAWD